MNLFAGFETGQDFVVLRPQAVQTDDADIFTGLASRRNSSVIMECRSRQEWISQSGTSHCE